MVSHGGSTVSLGLFPTAQDLFRGYFGVPSDLSRSGIQLVVLGAGVAAVRKVVRWLLAWFDRTFITRSYIDSRDESFQWIITSLEESHRNSLHFTVSTGQQRSKKKGGRRSSHDDEDDIAGPSIRWLPAPGMHLVTHQGRPILLRRNDDGERRSGSNSQGPILPLETLSLATIGWTPTFLHSFIEHSRSVYVSRDRSRTVVYVGTRYGGWNRLHSRPIRPLHTVILEPSLMDPLLADVRSYLLPETETWYAERGIPYRRGYLFSGPPGTGKTSLAIGLAGEFKLGVYLISLSGKGLDDDTLIELLGGIPRRAILLLEDIDVAFGNRADQAGTDSQAKNEDKSQSGVTTSGLLNALDGVAAQEGRIVILTTNYVERLDSALTRPGRVDMRLDFTLASHHEMRALFCNFYSEEKDGELPSIWASKLEEGKHSIAALQGYLMMHKRDPRAAIENVKAWEENIK